MSDINLSLEAVGQIGTLIGNVIGKLFGVDLGGSDKVKYDNSKMFIVFSDELSTSIMSKLSHEQKQMAMSFNLNERIDTKEIQAISEIESLGVKSMTPIFASIHPSQKKPHGTFSANSILSSFASVSEQELRGINLVDLDTDTEKSAIAFAKEAIKIKGVLSTYRVPRRWLSTAMQDSVVFTKKIDPIKNRQWNLRAIKWFDAEDRINSFMDKTPNVAILDTGIDISHPEILDSINTYDHSGMSNDDIIGHGTHVAGIISAKENDAIGMTGICSCNLNIWKVFSDTPHSDGRYYVDEVLYQRALHKITKIPDIRVVNLSLGGTANNPFESMLIGKILKQGKFVVAAMGNESTDQPTYPASYPGVIAVGATNEMDQKAIFSNKGDHIFICAPGTNIISTLPVIEKGDRKETYYGSWSGTSMAAPHVSAAIALILSINPRLKMDDVLLLLKDSITKTKEMGGLLKTVELGYGLLNFDSLISNCIKSIGHKEDIEINTAQQHE